MPIIRKKHKSLKVARTLAIGFFVIIMTGAILLWLPISSKSGEFTSFIDCVFTAASATSVTGISIYDTYCHWTGFGQSVILVLIQIGGLGLVTLVTFFNYAIGKKIGLVKASEVSGDISMSGLDATRKLFLRIVTFTAVFEAIGAIILMFTFVPKHGAYGIFMSIFMSISSFCNAGFDVIGIEGENIGLANYINQPQVLITLGVLIFIGGIGFAVWENLYSLRRTKKLNMHSKVVLIISGCLILLGSLVYFVVMQLQPEIFGDMSLNEKILSSGFASISARTAGFTAAPIPTSSEFSKVFTMMLMFVGAAPGSTAGGIKVTTLAILLATTLSVIKNKNETQLLGHLVPKKVVYKTLTVFVLSFGFICVAFVTIYLINPSLPAMDVLFEVFSAFSTTGFTSGVTEQSGVIPKIILCITMYIGRIGPFSVMVALITNKNNDKATVLPESNIMVG